MVNMGNIWDRTTEFLSENLGAIVPVALIAIFVPQSISGAIKQAGTQVGSGLSVTLVLLLLLPMIWGQLTITALTLDPGAGRGAAQATATRRFGSMILAMLILFAVLVLLFLPVIGALAASGVDLAALTSPTPGARPDISPATAGFVLLYVVAWVVFAAFVSVRFSVLLTPTVAAEGGVIGALRRSFVISNGIAWKLLGVVLLFGLVVGVASMAVTSVFGILFRVLDPGAGPFSIGSVIVAILGGLVTTTYYVIQAVFMAKVYRAATSARDGLPGREAA